MVRRPRLDDLTTRESDNSETAYQGSDCFCKHSPTSLNTLSCARKQSLGCLGIRQD
jgi:hypothetical protein